MTTTQRTREKRQRRIYAAIAGWALLGAASTGIVACSSADAAGSSTSVAAGSSSAGSSTAMSAAGTSTDGSTPAASSSTTPPNAAAAQAPPVTTSAAAEAATGAAAGTAAAGAYADGIYTAIGSYSSPGGEESITVTLTLNADVITDAIAMGDAAGPPSSQFQEQFAGNFAELVVGKNIDEVSLDKVAGSSLTPMGFNAAVDTIKSDALA